MPISQTLENFLKKEFPQNIFDDKQKTFLQRYSIDRGEGNTAPNQILKEVYTDRKNYGVGQFYTDNKHVEKAAQELQRIHNRFMSLCDRIKKKKEFENPPFDSDFSAFLDWWCERTEEAEKSKESNENNVQGIRRCYYCGIEEVKSQAAFEKGLVQSKKFTGTLHIDKKDPDEGYNCDNCDNCEFACALCNNAKSDIFTEKDFEKFIAPAIKKYWNDCILPQLEKLE